ncbi:MAG TPA: folylpolyglutamate synthase/dihydrofolate synthase family protein [Terriglobales bacterium]
MSYQAAIENLLALGAELAKAPGQKSLRKFDLENMRKLTSALSHPERRFPSILVAGTNGKGSTSATLASILRASRYRTGLYTSPHLLRPNERIAVNGEEISDVEFAEMHRRVAAAARELVAAGELELHPSFFEMITAMAFEYFASIGVEIAVLEVGMGGRLDATNISDPLLSIITDIALDHTEWLGDTIGKIAFEKAGTIRPNGVLVTLPQHPEANDVIGKVCMERNARAVSAAQYVPPVSPGTGKFAEFSSARDGSSQALVLRNRYPLTVMGQRIEVDSPLLGRHQLRNIALAVAAAEELCTGFGYRITPENIEQGIRQTQWPARFQVMAGEGARPDVLLDVAHNPAGAWALRAALSEHCGERPITLVFGAMRDKAIDEMAQVLFPIAERVIATRIENPRAAAPEEIREIAARMGADVLVEHDLARALALAMEVTPSRGVVVIAGSVYLVGAASAVIRNL